MTSTTTRHTSPAATRTGRSAAALPHDPGLDAILADPRLGPTAKLIAVALVKNWAWVKDHAWPSDRTIAAKVGKSPGHVQRCLRELEEAGHIAREMADDVPNGRRIWLLWRCPGGRAGARGGTAPAREASAAPARTERIVGVTGEKERGEIAIPERQRPEPNPTPSPPPAPQMAPAPLALPAPSPEPPVVLAPPPVEAVVPPPPPPTPVPQSVTTAPASPCVPLTPEQQTRLAELPAAARDQALLWLATGDPILVAEARKRLAPLRERPAAPPTLPEVLGRIREDPTFPALAADGLARAFADRRSYDGFLARCTEAWRGELPVERLVSAYDQARGPRAKNPGALFMHALAQRSL